MYVTLIYIYIYDILRASQVQDQVLNASARKYRVQTVDKTARIEQNVGLIQADIYIIITHKLYRIKKKKYRMTS